MLLWIHEAEATLLSLQPTQSRHLIPPRLAPHRSMKLTNWARLDLGQVGIGVSLTSNKHLVNGWARPHRDY